MQNDEFIFLLFQVFVLLSLHGFYQTIARSHPSSNLFQDLTFDFDLSMKDTISDVFMKDTISNMIEEDNEIDYVPIMCVLKIKVWYEDGFFDHPDIKTKAMAKAYIDAVLQHIQHNLGYLGLAGIGTYFKLEV